MTKVADYAQQRYPANTEAYWEQGVYHIGLMACIAVQRAPSLGVTEKFGDYNNWMLDRDGTGNRHNRLAAGQSWIEAYQASPERIKIKDTLKEIAAQTSA